MEYHAQLTLKYPYPGSELVDKVFQSLDGYKHKPDIKDRYGNASIIISLTADNVAEAHCQAIILLSNFINDSISLEVVETWVYHNRT